MSGKHDRGLDDEQETKLLLTGPIVIRGLRRSVKDALLPGKPSRHRAFAAAEETEGVGAIESALAPEESTTQVLPAGSASFPEGGDPEQTESPDGPGEDRVEDRRSDDEAPIGSDGEPPEESDAPTATTGDLDPAAEDAEASGDAGVERADGEPADLGEQQTDGPDVDATDAQVSRVDSEPVDAEHASGPTDGDLDAAVGADDAPTGEAADELGSADAAEVPDVESDDSSVDGIDQPLDDEVEPGAEESDDVAVEQAGDEPEDLGEQPIDEEHADDPTDASLGEAVGDDEAASDADDAPVELADDSEQTDESGIDLMGVEESGGRPSWSTGSKRMSRETGIQARTRRQSKCRRTSARQSSARWASPTCQKPSRTLRTSTQSIRS